MTVKIILLVDLITAGVFVYFVLLLLLLLWMDVEVEHFNLNSPYYYHSLDRHWLKNVINFLCPVCRLSWFREWKSAIN